MHKCLCRLLWLNSGFGCSAIGPMQVFNKANHNHHVHNRHIKLMKSDWPQHETVPQTNFIHAYTCESIVLVGSLGAFLLVKTLRASLSPPRSNQHGRRRLTSNKLEHSKHNIIFSLAGSRTCLMPVNILKCSTLGAQPSLHLHRTAPRTSLAHRQRQQASGPPGNSMCWSVCARTHWSESRGLPCSNYCIPLAGTDKSKDRCVSHAGIKTPPFQLHRNKNGARIEYHRMN